MLPWLMSNFSLYSLSGLSLLAGRSWKSISARSQLLNRVDIPGGPFFFLGALFPRSLSLKSYCQHLCRFQSTVVSLLLNVLESVFLSLVPGRQCWSKLALEILYRRSLSRVVCCHGWSSQSLSQDLIAHADAFWVIGCRKDLALRLQTISKDISSSASIYLPSSGPISSHVEHSFCRG